MLVAAVSDKPYSQKHYPELVEFIDRQHGRHHQPPELLRHGVIISQATDRTPFTQDGRRGGGTLRPSSPYRTRGCTGASTKRP